MAGFEGLQDGLARRSWPPEGYVSAPQNEMICTPGSLSGHDPRSVKFRTLATVHLGPGSL